MEFAWALIGIAVGYVLNEVHQVMSAKGKKPEKPGWIHPGEPMIKEAYEQGRYRKPQPWKSPDYNP